MTPDNDRPRPPILGFGFVAGTPILTADGFQPIEQLGPDDIIRSDPDDRAEGGDGRCGCPNCDPDWWRWN